MASVTQESEGSWIHLRGSVLLETVDMQFRADEVDYNRDTGDLEARGNVKFEHFARGEKLSCDRVEYNVEKQTGKFYNVTGTAAVRIDARPGVLTSQNPFYFQGEWAERVKDRYILHNGFLTDCLIPRPWWVLRGKSFDVIPGERAIARSSWFYVRKVPLFYTPVFYKSLEKQPRRSGFLTPNIGNSSRRGAMIGVGYFWAINRSYDMTYRSQLFSQRGFAHDFDFRGKVNSRTDFNLSIYGVNDRGTPTSPAAPGYLLVLNGKSELGRGWEARGELNYLSSFAFRQTFTESFHEAIFSETNSVGYLTRHWSDFGFYLLAERKVNFQSALPNDQIVLRKLPQVNFVVREHAVKDWPLWLSLDSSFGLVRRNQPLFQTRQYVERADFAPRATTVARWKGLALSPSFGLHETIYGSGLENGKVTGENLRRSARDVSVDLMLPELSRVFEGPTIFGSKFLGERVKHVIEPRVTYRYVTGVQDFSHIIRFDDTDLLTNTNEVEFSLTNRLLGKEKSGDVRDKFTWQTWYKRYFDPTFGGALVPGVRNTIRSSADLTGYAFLDGARRQSPIVSVVRMETRVGIEWRADYDPVQHGFVNSGMAANSRIGKVFVLAGHYFLKTDPVLAPSSNQFRGQISYGGDNKRGWNYGFSAFYDYKKGVLQYSQTQITYNTDCCGFSLQYQRFAFGTLYENRFRMAFAISNIGSVGTLKRQERIF